MVLCNVCGKPMEPAIMGWKQDGIPQELVMVLAVFDFPPYSVMRYECPDKHASAWSLPVLTEDKTKTFMVYKH